MGLVSNVLVEDAGKEGSEENVADEDELLLQAITGHTESLSRKFFPHELQKVHQNRLNQHLLLTQQLVMLRRKYSSFGSAQLFKP